MNLVAWQGEYLEDVEIFPTWSGAELNQLTFSPEVWHSHSPKEEIWGSLQILRKEKDFQKIIFWYNL